MGCQGLLPSLPPLTLLTGRKCMYEIMRLGADRTLADLMPDTDLQ